MHISRNKQRALHVLALGGHILHERDGRRKIPTVTCVTRKGMILSEFALKTFIRLRRKRLVESRSGSPYDALGRVAAHPCAGRALGRDAVVRCQPPVGARPAATEARSGAGAHLLKVASAGGSPVASPDSAVPARV
ncbi:YjhX family toxin [Cereibacter azotoformans]|uniref:YjhX family toxin n=1 Tax=Cereibacter azotoformans TaxID=43057 RepID=UPI002E26D194